MFKIILSFILMILIVSCSSGVSQAEYNQLLIEQEKVLKRKKAKEFPLVKDILTVFKNSKITSIELSDA